MKKIVFVIMAGTFLAFTACNNTPKGDEAAVTDAQAAAETAGATYAVNSETSVLKWIGSSPVKQHDGTLKIVEGALSVANGNVTGGTFTIDINSLTDNDLTGEYKAKLEGHLKSADFFNVDSFPTSKFEITAVEAAAEGENTHKVSGNLTLKDVTKNITFPAKVTVSENEVAATANFNINRADFNMSYGADNSLGDKMINAEVNINLDLKASK